MQLVSTRIGGKTAYYSLLGLVAIELDGRHRYRICLPNVWPTDSHTIHMSRKELWAIALNEAILDETKRNLVVFR